MIEQGTAHISGIKKPNQVDAGEMLRVLDALDKAGYKVVRKDNAITGVMINNAKDIGSFSAEVEREQRRQADASAAVAAKFAGRGL